MALTVTRTATPTIENGFVGSGDTVTISSFVVDGSDKALYVCLMLWQDVAGTGSASGITYNGVALTKIAEKTVTGGAMRAEIWRLTAPADATANIVATITGDTDARKMGAILFAGADQTDPDEATQTSEGAAGPITLSITTLTDGAIVIDCGSNFTTDALTVGSDQTAFMDDQTGSTGGVASYESKATAGAVTMSWTKAGSDDWAQCAVSVKPAAAVGGTRINRRMRLGVG